jgi:hypothetical protein
MYPPFLFAHGGCIALRGEYPLMGWITWKSAFQARFPVMNCLNITSFFLNFETCQRLELAFLPTMFNEKEEIICVIMSMTENHIWSFSNRI